ncbi:MAG TPA: alpha/beta hydrolase [Alphaproteobacteria bacterium]|nr:alpha/beta hydrolase [Alphaproteobacteria bacterium]
MPVYRSYDQAALDAQYDNGRATPDHPRWTDAWPPASAAARAQLGGRLNLAYGTGARQTLDFFPAPAPDAPILIFIHGGYWRARDKSDFTFVAPAYVTKGAAVVMAGYPLAPAVTMDEIVASLRSAVTWVFHNARSFGADPGRIHIAGHSAGGHLAAMMLSTDWKAHGLPADLVKGACGISGLYDLEPIQLCFLNQDLRMTPATARANSPLHLVPAVAGPLILAVGGKETDELRRQQQAYADAWRGAGLPLTIVPLPDDQHFSILDSFCDPANPLFQAVWRQISGSAR